MDQLVLRQTKVGQGVFAARDFRTGEILITFEGKVLTDEDIEYGSYDDQHSLQIGKHTHLGPSGKIDDFVNHSCSPNSGIRVVNGEFKLVAIRDIARGEEIVWDYATCVDDEKWKMQCACGRANCRGVIGDFSTLPAELQKEYASSGIVPEFVLQGLRRSAKQGVPPSPQYF